MVGLECAGSDLNLQRIPSAFQKQAVTLIFARVHALKRTDILSRLSSAVCDKIQAHCNPVVYTQFWEINDVWNHYMKLTFCCEYGKNAPMTMIYLKIQTCRNSVSIPWFTSQMPV